eukprot:61814-Rhodomonas_salina.1
MKTAREFENFYPGRYLLSITRISCPESYAYQGTRIAIRLVTVLRYAHTRGTRVPKYQESWDALGILLLIYPDTRGTGLSGYPE